LRPKSFEVLRYLLEHPGRVVSKEEVMTAVWPDTTVSDESLTRCVSDVLRALGDGQQHIIKTVPKRGYLVDVPVLPGTAVSGATEAASGKSAAQPSAKAHGGSNKTLEDARKLVSTGERKQVTVLYANFRTTLVAAAEHDPEEALAVFEAALDLVTDAVERYEGTVNVVTAHGAVALFGVPRTQEDHAIRAYHAAVQIQDAVRRYARTSEYAVGKALLVEIGLNSGELVTRASLGRSPGEYRAMGQTTELAARLEQMAPPGTTLLSRETLRLTESHIRAKAFAAPHPHNGLVYELVDVGPAQSRFQALAARDLTGFAGRDAEMVQLELIEARVRQGNGQMVAVIGEPGVGKSRLLHEFFRTRRPGEALMLDTASVSYRKATRYLPIIGLLQSYFAIDDRDGGGHARQGRQRAAGA
jgi:DNA-binding winged helix-turn-helix (wHTH) protein